MKVREGELEFDFDGAMAVDRLDTQGEPLPQGMKLADFVVEEAAQYLVVEIKDPSVKAAPASEQARFAKKMQNSELIHQELAPKARDSYCFLHLMERDNHPMLFVVVLGLEFVSLDPALLITFKDNLLRRIRQEARTPWKRPYMRDCVVVRVTDWATHFPQYGLRRVLSHRGN